MQYIQSNKFKYGNTSNIVCFNSNGVPYITNNGDYVIYSNNNLTWPAAVNTLISVQNSKTQFTIFNSTEYQTCCNVLISAKPSFTCSDITQITDTSSITFAINIDNEITSWSHKVDCEWINTYNVFKIIHTNKPVKSVSVTATSNIELSLIVPATITDDYNVMINCVVCYI